MGLWFGNMYTGHGQQLTGRKQDSKAPAGIGYPREGSQVMKDTFSGNQNQMPEIAQRKAWGEIARRRRRNKILEGTK